MKLVKTLSSFLAVALTSASLAVADAKITTVDVNRIINESSEAKAKRKELDAKATEARKKVEAKRSVLVETDKKLKELKVSDTSAEAENLRNDARDFERYVRDTDEDLKKEFLKFNKEITEKVLKLIDSYAKEHKIDIVLDKSDKSRTAVLFGDPSADITDEILAKLK